MLLEDEPAPQLRSRTLDVEPDHQAASAHVVQRGQRAQTFEQAVTHPAGVLDQPLGRDRVGHGDRRRAGQMVAAEGGAQHPLAGLELRRDEYAADREAVAHALGSRNQIGTDARPLVGEETPRAAVPRLDLVEDQHRPRALGRLAQRAKESLLGAADARHALNAFDDHSGELARGELALDRPDVVQRHELHVGRGVEGRADRGIVGHLDGARRTAVESSAEGQHLGPPRVERRQFQSVFIGFGARVAEEKPVVVVTRQCSQPLGQRVLQRVFHRIGVESQPCGLLRDHPHVMRMRMADRNDGMAAVEVEVLRACGIVDVAAAAAHRLDRI